jgi:hypothetical protein
MNKPKAKAIEYLREEDYLLYLVPYLPKIEKAIDIAISEATHDCEEKIKLLTIRFGVMETLNNDLQKENTELKEKIEKLNTIMKNRVVYVNEKFLTDKIKRRK